MSTSQILGAVATTLVVVGYVPQIGHLVRQRCTAGMSILAFSLWCLASLLFLIHAAVIGDAVFVVVQAVNLGAGALIVGFCTKYKGGVCPFHRELYGSREGRSCTSWREQPAYPTYDFCSASHRNGDGETQENDNDACELS